MNESAEDRDHADMARLTAGNDAALSGLMERHSERLFYYLIRCLQDQEEAADLAQESFIRVYQNRTKFNPNQSFSTWLYAIATNLVRDRIRSRRRHPRVPFDSEEDGAPQDRLRDVNLNPSESLDAQERTDAIRNAVAQLPEEIRTPLILAEYEEKSQAEIAVILDCSIKAVETRIYRARKQLREVLGHLLEKGS